MTKMKKPAGSNDSTGFAIYLEYLLYPKDLMNKLFLP